MSAHYKLHPSIHCLGRAIIQIIIGYAICWQECLQPLLIQNLPVVYIILLSRNHGQIVLFVAPVLTKFNTTYHLLVDKIGCDRIFGGLMPRREYLFAKEETPRSIALLGTLFFRVLFTL